VKKILELPTGAADNLSKIRESLCRLGAEPGTARYGWIRREI
jgi:hypothetical protein